MPEAVIVDAIRTPIGRAVKGSLKTVRADELAALPIRTLMQRNPDVDFSETTDVLMGAASGSASRATTWVATPRCWRGRTTMCPAAPSTDSAPHR